ncbi:hypothetical protein QUB80_26075 [Chlorogloeopsis sp. ULAP01]|uniref:hypothetical protein n=1 Tax=Chlorogloeopsis sp. ULAP01 TaxID=3056483 RepID=UPI0025AAFE1C|nr:hypothetical protein [Chlorogloeopsis sp. ULAP01]MDM9384148.1 hypothetical protein [Chlorogloeopsis sp. ULAP01]
MLTNDLTNEQAQAVDTEKIRDPEEIVFDLYRAYEPLIDPHLWPWETKRWHELVFCLLTTIAEPEISPETTREVTRALSEWRLLEVDVLAGLNPAKNEQDASNPVLVTIMAILQQSGFDADQARIAVTVICEAASGLKQKYEGKVQKYFRKYGALMLDELAQNFSFTGLNNEDAKKAVSIWLQNTLNMPVPASNPMADKVCEKLGVEYKTLVEVADKLNINVASLDEALRAYWEDELEEEDFLPAEEE